MPPDTALPLEIIREVFSHIDDDDKHTLSVVAQTSSWFQLDMQRRIFQSVICFQFWRTITKRPHLGALVRRISFKCFQTRRDVMIKPSVASFVDILARLTRLEHFTFEPPDCGPITFRHLAMPIRSVICKAMQESKALTRLDLAGLCSVPATLAVQPANLVDLSLVSVASNNTGASGAYGTSSISTDQLKGVVQLLKDSSLSLANLHTLEIEAQQTNKLDIEYLLSRVAKEKLRALSLRRPQTDARELTFSKDRHTIDLHAFRSLTQLNLSVGQLYIAHGRGDGKTPIPWVISILETLPDFPIDGARKPRLRLELNGNLFSRLSGKVNDIPWELVAKVLLSRQNGFEEVEISAKYETASTLVRFLFAQ
ncbi:hypothetical protein BJ165DRAFT_1405943 [Panaeolus papilionaceus]|nr:hypothetical protein BJ165DRAFT_1405943 [Panaeolus papilionaceus]